MSVELRSQALADNIWKTVHAADNVNADIVLRDLFVRIGRSRIDRGELLNRLVKEIANEQTDS